MPSVIINYLPLDVDGHQFWVAAVDRSGNTNDIDMSSTGYIQLPPLTAPPLSNESHIITQRPDMLVLTDPEARGALPIFQEGDDERISPMLVSGVPSTDENLASMEILISDDWAMTTGVYSELTALSYDAQTATYYSRTVTFSCIDRKYYYFRARVIDQVGRIGPWSVAQREQCGDRTGPPTVLPEHVSIQTQGHTYTATISNDYPMADDHAYFAWWLNTEDTYPGGTPVREFDRQFLFGNKSGFTLYMFVAAVDKSGNFSTGYGNNSVGSAPFVPSQFWIDTGNVTDISGDTVLNVSNRGIEDEDGNLIFDFTSGSGDTDYNAVLEGAINFGTGGALHLTDNAVSFAGSPIVGMEIIARGLKLYQDANNYFILEKDGASSINMEIVGGTFKTSGGTSRIEMDYDSIRGYNAGVQRFNLDSDGSGWLGSFAAFNWDTDGNVNIGGSITVTHIEAVTGTIAGWDISSSEITVTPVATVTARLHSDGYIAFGSPAPTGYGNNVGAWLGESGGVAKLSLYTDSNNFLQWDGSTLSSTGINLDDAVITASVFQTATSGQRVVINSADGLRAFNSSPAQTVSIDTDGSGWFGLTGTRAIEWNTAGALLLAGAWSVDDETIETIFDTDKYLSLSTTSTQEAVYFYDPTPTSGDVRFVGMGTLHNGTSWTTETGMGVVVYNGATYDKYLWISDTSIEIAGWEFTEELFRSAAGGARVQLDSTQNRVSIFSDDTEKVVMGYLEGLGRNKAWGTATGGSTTYLDDSTKDYNIEGSGELSGLTISITSGTGSPQTRTITSNTATRIFASFSPAAGSGSVYAVRYTSSNYGFWALDGDTLMIDGDMTYESGDWIVQNDASLKIINGSGNEIIRLGTDSGEKGLFIYNTSSDQLAKYISDEIYIGEPGNFLRYTTAGGLVIEGDVTVAGSVTPRQPFDEDALIIWPLDSFPADQSSSGNHGDDSYGASVVQTTPGVGGAWASLFPNGVAAGDYYRAVSTYALGERTITFWAKSSDTAVNTVFQHGGGSTGGFHFNYNSSRPLLYLGSNNYRYWVNPPEQDDNEWHFWCIEIAGAAQSDIDDSKLYVDLLEQTVSATANTGGTNAWGDLLLGYGYSGSLQDYRVYNRVLTEAERDGIFSNPMSRTTTTISGDKISTGTIESNNWGSSAGSQFNLNDGEFILGGSSSPVLDFSGGVLALTGAITLTTPLDATDISDVDPYATGDDLQTLNTLVFDGAPSGSGFWMDSSHMGYHSGGAWTTYLDNTGKFYLGTSEVTTIPQTLSELLDDSTGGEPAGMYMDGTHLGFWNGSAWDVYLGSSGSTGQFYLGGATGDLRWDGNDLILGAKAQLKFGARLVHGGNLLAPDIRLWHETTIPNTDNDLGYFTNGSNPYGGDDNNAVVNTLNPFGKQDLVWECTATAGDASDGGWGYNGLYSGTDTLNKDLRYRYNGWVKRVGGIDGGSYFGLYNNATQTSNLTATGADSGNSNPYFLANFDLPNNVLWENNAVPDPSFNATSTWTAVGSPPTCMRTNLLDPHTPTYHWVLAVDAIGQGVKSAVFTLDGYTQYRFSIWLDGGVDQDTKWVVYVDNGIERHYIKEKGFENLNPHFDRYIQHVTHFQTNERSAAWRVYIICAEVDTISGGGILIDDVYVGSQLIMNGDAEEDFSNLTASTGWRAVGPALGIYTTTSSPHSGTYCHRVTTMGVGGGIRTSKLKKAAGTINTYSADHLTDTSANFDIDGTEIGDMIQNETVRDADTIVAIDSGIVVECNAPFSASAGHEYTISSQDSYIKLMGGYQYRATIWINSGNCLAHVSDGVNTYSFLENGSTTLTPSGWQQYILDFVAEDNSDSAWIEVTTLNASAPTNWEIDDVTLQETPWYLLSAFFHPYGYAGTEGWGGAYHYKTGYKVPQLPAVDFKSMITTNNQMYRLFLNNSSTITNQQYQYSPAIYIVDGSEPTLASLLGNSLDMGWNIENTTSISKYLLSSPVIRGGNYADGNYIQMDEYGIRGFGNNINTFNIDALTGSVTLKSSDSGQRLVIDGVNNELSFFDTGNNEIVQIKSSAYGGSPGIRVEDGTIVVLNGAGTEPVSLAPGYLAVAGFDQTTFYVHSTSTSSPSANTWSSKIETSFNATDNGSYRRVGLEVDLDHFGTTNSHAWGIHSTSTGASSDVQVGVCGTGRNIGAGAGIGGQFNSDDIAIRLTDTVSTEETHTNFVDFKVDGSGYLNIIPSGDRVRLWESGAVGNDYTDMWTDVNGLFNILPKGVATTQTGKLRLWDATGTGGDYADLYSAADGRLLVDPGGLSTNIISMSPTVGSSMFLVSCTHNTLESDPGSVPGIRMNNSSVTAGTQAGIHFSTNSAYCGIIGRRVAGNTQSMDFYTEYGSRTVKMILHYDGGLMVGAPTGGGKGPGTINAQAVYDDNTLLGPDFVFDKGYKYLSIPEMKTFYNANKHLPTIRGRDEFAKEGNYSVGQVTVMLWETIEVQAKYITELEERITKLEKE